VHVALGLDAHPWSNFTASSLGFLGPVEVAANMAVEEKHQRPESGLPEDQAVLAAGEIVHSEPFCIHDRKTKWLLVGMVALTGFLR
jgi:hypothetical protein